MGNDRRTRRSRRFSLGGRRSSRQKLSSSSEATHVNDSVAALSNVVQANARCDDLSSSDNFINELAKQDGDDDEVAGGYGQGQQGDRDLKVGAADRGVKGGGSGGEVEDSGGNTYGRQANKISDLYEVMDMLGDGSFSKVFRGICRKDGSSWALKCIPNTVWTLTAISSAMLCHHRNPTYSMTVNPNLTTSSCVATD